MTELLITFVMIIASYFIATRMVIPILTAIFGDPDE